MKMPDKHFFSLWAFSVLIGLLLATPVSTFAFTNFSSQYISRNWQTEAGLPHNSVNAVAQTKAGYMWVATREGLARFDGNRFQLVHTESFSSHRNRGLTSLCEKKDGSLWIGSDDGSVSLLKEGKVSIMPVPSDARSRVSSIHESREGSLWIGTETKGLFQFQQGQFRRWTMQDGMAHDSIRSICEDGDGHVWVATAAGVNCIRNGRIETFGVQQGLLHNATRSVCIDRQGYVWIATHLGVTRMKEGKCASFTTKHGLSDNYANVIFEDRNGQIWIGTFGGLNRVVKHSESSDEQVQFITETQADGSPYERVQCIFEDREGGIWVGTRDGLSRLKPRVLQAYTRQDDLTYNHATSVMEDRDGNIWIGFWGGGINQIRDGKVTAYTTQEGLCSDLILTVHQSRSGRLWFGADYDAGLNLLNTNGTIVQYRDRLVAPADAVKVIQDDRQNSLWIGTRTGLGWHKGRQFRRYGAEHGLPSEIIEAICEDRKGRLWFGTAGGLALITNNAPFPALASFTSITNGLSHNAVTAIHEDQRADDTFWVGTRAGLNRVRGGEITRYTSRDGLFRDEIFAVVEDDLGHLWMSCREGIFCVAKSELNDFAEQKCAGIRCVSFGNADGMASAECKGSGRAAGFKAHDGRLWFPTSKGVVVVDPRKVPTNAMPPAVYIEQAKVNGTPVDATHGLRFVAGRQEFVFTYTALEFSAPEKIQFKYKLEGLDQNWINAGDRREAHYGHVPPGEYRFRVIASNGSGIWNEQGASILLSLQPPFWKTTWFLSLAGLMVAGVTAGAARYTAVSKLQRHLREVEQQHALEKERTRIAQDMHDDLGSRLTEILMLSERSSPANLPEQNAERSRIAGAARQMAENLDAIVWAVEPRNDSLERVAAYLYDYAVEFLAASSIRCRLDVPRELPSYVVTSETRHQLFMVVKEALNNIAKYAQASEVWFRLTLKDSQITICVEDNGAGFATSEKSSFGNGLINMEKRIRSIGGSFQLESEKGKGTQIAITVPLKTRA
jgi:ligand-binding sensor domain-containing protein/signal transduction histidine kinase